MELTQEKTEDPEPIAESNPHSQRQQWNQYTKDMQLIREKQNLLSNAYHEIVLPPLILNTVSNLESSINDGSFGTLLQLLRSQLGTKPSEPPEPIDALNISVSQKHKTVDELQRCASSYYRKEKKDRIEMLADIERDFVELLNNDFPQVKIGPEQNLQTLINNGVKALGEWCIRPDIAELNESVRELGKSNFLKKVPLPTTPLQDAKTHQSLTIMLKSIDCFEPFLKVILKQSNAFNERIHCDLDTPLHYAVRSQNKSFIEWLLEQNILDINCRNKQMKTALFLLCEQYNLFRQKVRYSNQKPELLKCRECILLLLERGADFNICSSKALLPYELLTQRGKPQSQGSSQELKDQMQLEEQKFFTKCVNMVQGKEHGPILKRHGDEATTEEFKRMTFELMEIFLRLKDLDTFEMKFKEFKIKHDDASKVITLLLHTAVELNLQKCADLIVDRVGNMIFAVDKTTRHLKYRVELKGLLKKACESGNSTILAKLLGKMEKDNLLVNEEKILVYTLSLCATLPDENEHKSHLLKCAKLMATDKRIVHTTTDIAGNTALQFALKHGFTNVAIALAVDHRFLFLGVQNKKGETPLDCASYEFCKEYFDQCVSRIYNTKDILIDLNGINPYFLRKTHNKHIATPKVRSHKWTDSGHFRSEMQCLKVMANSKTLKQILHHPVIYTFILVKWLRFNMWHFINLLLTMAAAVAFCSFSIVHMCYENYSVPWYIASWCGLAYVVIRELLQWTMFGNKYFRLVQNWIDMAHILGMIIVLGFNDYSLISSLVAIIFAIQIIQLIGSLPFNSISTYRCMFRVVALNFIKSLALFCPLILAFAYSFYLYYNNKLVPAIRNGTDNPFDSATAAGVKIMVMASGEFEASEMNINGSVLIIFLLFIFCVPMVIQNLINGLAVSDISEIRKESEAISLSEKVLLLARFESGLNRSTYKPIRHILEYLRSLSPGPFFRNYHHVIQISVKDDGKIMIASRYSQHSSCEEQSLNCMKSACHSRPTNSELDMEMVAIEVKPQTDSQMEQPLLDNKGATRASAPKTPDGKKKNPSKKAFGPVARIPILGILSPLATLDENVLEELLSIAKANEIRKTKKFS